MVNLPYVFEEVKCRTARFSKTFFPDAIFLWNDVITTFEDFPTFENVKKYLISLLRPKRKSVFDTFDPNHLRKLFQLRLGLSKLRHHKKRHNFLDTPSEICTCLSGVEDTGHFLFSCPLFVIERNTLITSVKEILSSSNIEFEENKDWFLYGHPSLWDSDNKKILKATLEFIKATDHL